MTCPRRTAVRMTPIVPSVEQLLNAYYYLMLTCRTVSVSNDLEFVKDLLDGMFNMKMEENEIEKMFRLGRWEEGKARPLLVTFRKFEDKEFIMANLSNLKKPLDKFKGVSIAHDLHPKEREENRRMVEEAKREHEINNGESAENYRFQVVGRGQRKKVIVIKRKSS